MTYDTYCGPGLRSKVDHVGRISPALQRHLAGTAPMLRNTTLGNREWGLVTMAMLIAIGDAPDQLRTYLDIAVAAGATNDEVIDVINQAAIYVGGPRAVNALRSLENALGAERDRLLPGVTESVVRVGDHDTVVWDNGGDGVPMLLMHCLSLDRRVWRDVYPQLASTGRVVAYDIRNHGSARGAPLVRDLDHVADDAAALLDALDIEQADVYGASYGGAIAQHLVLNHPDRVRSLALIATSPWCPTDTLDARAADAEADGMDAQVAESLIRWFAPETIAENGWAVRYGREMIRKDSAAEWAASWRAMARLDVVDRLAEICVPTVAIAGQQDLSAIPEALQAIADGVDGCRYVLVDPGTHMMPMEQPDALAGVLLEFRHDVQSGAFGREG